MKSLLQVVVYRVSNSRQIEEDWDNRGGWSIGLDGGIELVVGWPKRMNKFNEIKVRSTLSSLLLGRSCSSLLLLMITGGIISIIMVRRINCNYTRIWYVINCNRVKYNLRETIRVEEVR